MMDANFAGRPKIAAVQNDVDPYHNLLRRRYLDELEVSIMSPKEFKKMLDELFLLNRVLNIGDSIPWIDFMNLQGYIDLLNSHAYIDFMDLQGYIDLQGYVARLVVEDD